MAEGDVLFVDVVAADRRVWEGEAHLGLALSSVRPEQHRVAEGG